MARFTIFDAAGPTNVFFYTTTPPLLVIETETRLAYRARIVGGPHDGERVITDWFGTFDTEANTGEVSAMRQSVHGRAHFRLAFDEPTAIQDLEDTFLIEPLAVIGNRFANLILGDRTEDRLHGGGGADRLIGYGDADDLRGGFGADRFIFLSTAHSREDRHDTIRDFGDGRDLIVLRAIDADRDTRGNQAFDFIAGDDFSGVAGELRTERSGAATWLYGDVDGDGAAELAVRLAGRVAPTEDDILL